MDQDLKNLIESPEFEQYHKRLQEPRKFNPFDVLRYADYEIRHSNVLAWLLQPSESHGLHDKFLRAFVQCLDLNEVGLDLGFSTNNVRVERELDYVDITIFLDDARWVRLFFVGGPTSLCGGGEAGGSWIRQRVVVVREAAKGTGVRRYLCRQRPLGGFRWYSRASWKVSVRIKAPAARGALRTASRGRHADRPFDEPATSTARRIAAATWMMSSTTVASRAYAVVPARRSRWSRGASRTSSAPAAGSARHRADAGRGAARSPDAQPASCRRSFPCDFRARTAPSTRHRWRPRPDRQSLPGCVGRDVLAGACVPTPGPAGAVPVRVRSRSSVGLRWRRGRLWHPRRQHRPPRPGDRCGGRRFAALARRLYVLGILSPHPLQVPFPRHRTRTPRECPEGERA